MKYYDHKRIEQKWQQYWDSEGSFAVSVEGDGEKMYILDMFPYPSSAGLHVGHPEGYTATDIVSRFERMRGKQVLHPMGWDAFGLPAENFAIKQGVHPKETTNANIKNFRRQIKSLGFSFDWSRELSTASPDYYRWTQWLFLELYKQGLAYKKKAPVNWCPECQTVLAREQVIDGHCERCKSEVVQKDLEQWFFKITAYADRLLSDMEGLDWPQAIKLMQKNWIGRSEGAELFFELSQEKKHFVLLHGFTGSPEGAFFPWLQGELESRGHTVEVPLLPSTENPVVMDQVQHVLDTCSFDENTVLLGHSLGTVVAMKVAEVLDKPISKLVLAAGFAEPRFKDHGRPFEKTFDWKFDFERIRSNVKDVQLLHDVNDTKVPGEQAHLLEQYLEGDLRVFAAHEDHITGLKEHAVLQASLGGLRVFTTRPDTVFGATYMVVAPEHRIVASFLENQESGIKNQGEVEKYINTAKKKSELDRTDLAKEKMGVELEGVKVVNPATGAEIPVWVADYVLMGYGTGAIMAVPGHDERDFEFAKKYSLPIKIVVKQLEESSDNDEFQNMARSVRFCFTGEGVAVNSGKFNGLGTVEFKKKIVEWLYEKGAGESEVNYRLRDWLVSRQRYWGAPIPIIYCRTCWESSKLETRNSKKIQNQKSEYSNQMHEGVEIDGEMYAVVPVPEDQLPVELPEDVDFRPTGESPLAGSKEFHEVACPECGATEGVRREVDTMDTFVDSSWYFLRYTDPENSEEFASKAALKKWCPVDLYVGGAEHAVLHLLYARFITKALACLGYVDFDEPFLKLRNQGMILAEDGRKMSKSIGNVINPDEVIDEYGADTMRLYEMFMGPLEDAKPWSTKSIIGVRRFLEKVWLVVNEGVWEKGSKGVSFTVPADDSALMRLAHQTIKKVTSDIEKFKFNTAISAMMIYVNELAKSKDDSHFADHCLLLTVLLSPFAPHMAEELWELLGNERSIMLQPWPTFDEALAKSDTIQLVFSVNGKVRDKVQVEADISEDEAKELALASEKVQGFLDGGEPKKVIFVKGKLVNIVV